MRTLTTVLLLMCCNFAAAQTLSTQEALRLPQAKADHRISYGSDPHQFGDLRLPASHPSKTGLGGSRPYPVAIVIHGGCWSADYDLIYMGNMSAALAKAGIATWSIEYRRVGDTGGGWPGTFQDVAKAADYVRELAKQYPLDVKRIVAVGHSAGGHLVLWLAARHNLPKSSELYAANPIAIRGLVSLAGIPDLVAAGADTGCGDMGYRLMGGKPEQFPERYKQGSPAELLPLGVKQVLIHGEADKLVPQKLSVEYEARARKSGDDVMLASVTGAGHFELVVPTTEAWKRVEEAVAGLLH
jgi:acetyl esterase/lipase